MPGWSSLTGGGLSMVIWPRDKTAAALFKSAARTGARPMFENPRGALVEICFAYPPSDWERESDDQSSGSSSGSHAADTPAAAEPPPREALRRAVMTIRLYGWMESLRDSGDTLLAMVPLEGAERGAEEEGESDEMDPDGAAQHLRVAGGVPLRLHLWCTRPEARAGGPARLAHEKEEAEALLAKLKGCEARLTAHFSGSASRHDGMGGAEEEEEEGLQEDPQHRRRVEAFLRERDDLPATRNAAAAVMRYARVLEQHPEIIDETVLMDIDRNVEIIQFVTAEQQDGAGEEEGETSSSSRDGFHSILL
eukprot:gene8136-5670_t